MRNEVIKAVESEKLIVIVRGIEKEKLIPLAEAMYAGGVRLLEITYSANGQVSDEETAKTSMAPKIFWVNSFATGELIALLGEKNVVLKDSK